MTELPLPNLAFLSNLLASWRGSRAAVVDMTDDAGRPMGNNGDRLMMNVFYRVLKESGISLAAHKTDDAPDLIIVPPNGALLEAYNFPRALQARLAKLPDVPVVIFPSSSLFPSWNPAQMFQNRASPTQWILREKYSFDHLTGTWGQQLTDAGVQLLLDHDIVVSGHKFVPSILGSADGERWRFLVAAREDKEANRLDMGQVSSAPPSLKGRALSLVLNHVPPSALRSHVLQAATATRRRSASAKLISRAASGGVACSELHGRRTNIDISSTIYATFDQYCHYIVESNLVVTNRLHVALPASIIGARVYLIDGGYHKLRGVYDRSLKEMANVSLITTR